MTRSDVAMLMALLRAAYPAAEHDDATPEIYEAMLLDLELAAAKAAVTRLIGTSKWFPKISEIRREALVGNDTPPELAWGQVLREISRVGSYDKPKFDSALIAQAVDAVGWRAICKSEFIASERARFIDAYRVSLAQAERSQVLRAFPAAREEQPLSLADAMSRLLPPPEES